MNVIEALGLSKLRAKRAEMKADVARKAESDTVDAFNNAMLDYAGDESAANKRAVEAAYKNLCKLVFGKALAAGGSHCTDFPLDVTTADGRTVREICADVFAPIEDVNKAEAAAENARAEIAFQQDKLANLTAEYITPVKELLAKAKANLADREAELETARAALEAAKKANA